LCGIYLLLLVIGSVICIESGESVFAQRVEWYLEREIATIKRMASRIANCYWFLRCLFVKRWWQYRTTYTLSANYGMSWEGKEKDYHKRYAAVK
jgi:hypothetical protein